MRFNRLYSKGVDKAKGVQYDQVGRLETHYSKKDYPDKLRRIKCYDQESKNELVFLTNNTELEATEIAML